MSKTHNIRKFIRQVLEEALIPEEISASEAYRDENALKAVIDGKRDLGFITLKTATIPEKTFWDEIKKHGLKTVNLPLNPYNAFIYFRKGAELNAIELANIANKYGGYLSYKATKEEAIRIGQLLGYKESDIQDYVDSHYEPSKEVAESYTPKLTLEESIGRIRKLKLNGTYYHGTSIGSEDDLFSEFNPGHSDWDAVWFASDENISEEFAENSYRDDNEIKAVYEVNLKCNAIADIDYTQAEEIKNQWGLYDFRESIPMLKQKGFNGWKTTGSIGYNVYDDIALFNLGCAKIVGVKLFIDDNWTDYMPLSEAQDIIDSKRVSVDEDINVPINVGDEVLGGKFLNKKTKVKTIKKDGKGGYSINDKPLLRFRIQNKKGS